MGSFLKDIVGGAIGGVKKLVENARVGREAKAGGWVQPNLNQLQETQLRAVQTSTQSNLLVWILGAVGLLLGIFLITKKR